MNYCFVSFIHCNSMQMNAVERTKQTSDWHAHSRCVDLCFVALIDIVWKARRKKQRVGSGGTISVFQISLNSKCSDLISEVQGTFYKLTILPNFLIISSKPACCEHSKWILECLYWSVTHEFNNKKCLVMQAFLNLRIEFRVFTTTVVQIESAKIK